MKLARVELIVALILEVYESTVQGCYMDAYLPVLMYENETGMGGEGNI